MWPTLFQNEYLTLPNYLVISSLIFSIGVLWVFFRAPRFNLDQNLVLDAMFFGLIGVFIGARGFHVFLEGFDFYRNNPGAILKVWYGGFVFYGGLLGALVALYIFSKLKRTPLLPLLDLGAPVLALLNGFGRLACLSAGCCYGSPTTLPWGIVFPEESSAPPNIPIHPTQFYLLGGGLLEYVILINLERRNLLNIPGKAIGIWFLLHGITRGVTEQFRDDFRGGQVFNLSVSTWISFGLILAGIFLICRQQGEGKSVSRLT